MPVAVPGQERVFPGCLGSVLGAAGGELPLAPQCMLCGHGVLFPLWPPSAAVKAELTRNQEKH